MSPDHLSSPAVTLARIGEHRLMAVIRSASRADALRGARDLVEAGVHVLEITFTTPEAPSVISTLRAELAGDTLVGAGTICSTEQARTAADCGADFLVSPGSPPPLLTAMLATGLLVVPGVMTPTEIVTAHDHGVLAVKLFPATVIGPAGLTALRGPFPDLAFIPTGGITKDQVSTWLEAGAYAVGVGSGLLAVDNEGPTAEFHLLP